MKTFWNGIKKGITQLKTSWKVAKRVVLFSEKEDLIQVVVFVRSSGKLVLEEEHEISPTQIPEHPQLRHLFSFPRVLLTQFGTLLPLEKVQIQEWVSELQKKEQVLKVLPYEFQSQLPSSVDEIIFDSVLGRPDKKNPMWLVATAYKKDVSQVVSFWQELGLQLDFLDWEGNLQSQFLQQHCVEEKSSGYMTFESNKATHFIAVDKGGVVSQKVFLDATSKARQKRVQLKLHTLKEKNNDFKQFEKKGQWLLTGLDQRTLKCKQMNFLRPAMAKKAFAEMTLKKAPALIGLLCAGLLAFQVALELEKWGLRQKLSRLKQAEEVALKKISEKTGLSVREIRTRPMAKEVFSNKTSLLTTFIEATKKLSETTATSYRGKRLELSLDGFLLEGVANTFAEVETIERDLAETPTLKNVRLVRSQKKEDQVYFRIEAERQR